jgi:hypothetical protein
VSAPWSEGDGYGHGPDEGGLPDIADLTGPVRDPGETLAEVRHQLGIGTPRARHRPPDGPDVHGLAEGLGLR